MSATPSRTCPECGRSPSHEQHLFRTRRSPPLACVAGLLALCSYAVLKAPRVAEYGWTAAIPSTPMIVGLPYLPLNVVFDHDSEEWTLSDRFRGELWPWQQQLVRWRARRLFKSSTRIDHLVSAAAFLERPDETNVETMLPWPAAANVVVAVVQGEDDYAHLLSDRIPTSPPAVAHQDRFAPELIRALREGDIFQARCAAIYANLAAFHAEALAELLDSRLDRREPLRGESRAFATCGLLGLSELAASNEPAWHRYQRRMNDADGDIRRRAVLQSASIEPRRDAVLPLVEAALDDADDRVVVAAARAIAFMVDPLTPYEQRLATLGTVRPQVGPQILAVLGSAELDGPATLALARRCLALTDPASIEQTLEAIESMGSRAAPLREDLERFATQHVSVQAAQQARSILESLNAANGASSRKRLQ